MVSLVNSLNNPQRAFGSHSTARAAEADEANAILAALCAFLAAGIALSLHALGEAAVLSQV